MKLLASSRSPYGHKVRVALAEKAIACELVDTPASSPEVAAANPLAKVPVLLRDDGQPLYDSSVIVEYLDGLVAAPRLIPAAFEDRIEVRRWEALGNGILDATVAIRHENQLAPGERKGADFYAKQQKKIDSGLLAMQADLGAGDFCFGDRFTLADISCGCALAYLDKALADFDWRAAHPGLARHYACLQKRPSFQTA